MQPDQMTPQPTVTRATTYDAGLRAHFQKVYNTMSLGLLVTGGVAFGVSNSPALMEMIFGNKIIALLVMFAPMAFLWFGFNANSMMRKSVAEISTMFYALSAVWGLSLSFIFLAYTATDIARVFFITAGMFAGTSVYGYTTKKDLSGMGGMMVMGMIGLIIASLVNLFLQSTMVQFVTSVCAVIIYTGLVAWNTQQIKESYNATYGGEANGKMAVMGALQLYVDFIGLFMSLLQLLGNRR
ncbi:MAG: rane protein [Micavibrio sp.]|nr:rane protein [Micavibrio sp.]